MSHVLLIDDDAALRDAMEALLTDCGHAVTVAADGLAGVHAALSHTPDAIVSDVDMPLVDGREMVRIFKTLPQLWNVPIVLMSGAATTTPVPVVAILRKPVDCGVLLGLLDEAIEVRMRAAAQGRDGAAQGLDGMHDKARAEACTRMIRRGIELMHDQKKRVDAIRRCGADTREALVLYERLSSSVLTLVRLCGAMGRAGFR